MPGEHTSNSLVIDNTIERNSVDGIAIEFGSSNRIERNTIVNTGQVAVHLWAGADGNVESRDLVVADNVIQNAQWAVSLERSSDYFIGHNSLTNAPVPQGLNSTKKDRPKAALQQYDDSPAAKRVAEIIKTKPKQFKYFREQSQHQGPDLVQLGDFAPQDIRGQKRATRPKRP